MFSITLSALTVSIIDIMKHSNDNLITETL